jgi:Tfp pilus assembly protein PilF
MHDHAEIIAAALPTDLRAYAPELAAFFANIAAGQAPVDLTARLAAQPMLGVALAALVGTSLSLNGQPLIVAGNVGTLQQITLSGGFVERIIGTQITIQFPPTPKQIDLAAAQELLAAMPLDVLPPPTALPELHRMPLARNPHFVGRENDLLTLARTLKGEGGTLAIGSSAVATGIGGIGKTNLATEFMHRYGRFFAGGVYWISFADPGTVAAEIAACGAVMEFPGYENLKLEDQVLRVTNAWAQAVPRLLIFDNCDDTTPGQAEALIQQWRPTSGGCRVLITSRKGTWSSSLGVATLALRVLSRAESIALLCKHRPDLAADNPALDAIAEELGDLPLALHLAGSFLEVYKDSSIFGDPANFIVELRDTRLLDHEALQGVDVTFSPTNHELHVARTFALSYRRLDETNPVDAQSIALLARAAHLAPGEAIPRDLLLATLEVVAEDKAAQRTTERGLLRLIALGLLEQVEDGAVRIHRLVAHYVDQVSGDSVAQAAVERVIATSAAELTYSSTLAPIRAFLPILRSVTDGALLREGEAAATLCTWLGRHLKEVGSYEIAQPYIERSVAIHERVVGAEHPDTALSLNNLAGLYQAEGNYPAARPLHERALAIYEQVLGDSHPDTARSLNNLAGLYQAEGNYAAARSLYERALAIYEQVVGASHPDTAGSLNNLAYLYQAEGNYPAARPLYEQALAIREQVLGASHPDIAGSLNNLAALYEIEGNYPAARPLYEQALAIREQVLGDSHPDTATSLNNLAVLHQIEGNYAAARPLYEQALAIVEQVLGASHPDTALSLNNLAGLYQAEGNYPAARPLHERALAIYEQVLGDSHPDTARSLNNLAGLYQAEGNYAAARPLFEGALAIREQVLGDSHPDTAKSLNNLAALYQIEGNYPAARPLHERALAIYEQVLGASHPDTARSLNNLAYLYQAEGNYPAARPLHERALAIYEQVLGDSHPDTARSLHNLAVTMYYQGDSETARHLMQRALTIQEQRLGPDHPDTQGSRQNLAVIDQRLTGRRSFSAIVRKYIHKLFSPFHTHKP